MRACGQTYICGRAGGLVDEQNGLMTIAEAYVATDLY